MPEQKTPPKIPIASITPTQRVVFPARPIAGAGRYRSEEPANITIVKVERESRLTPEQLAKMGTPGGQRVSNVKEMLASLKTERDQLSDRLHDDSGSPVDRGRIADSTLFARDYPQGAKFEAPGGEVRLEATLLYCGGNINRTFLLTNASRASICELHPAFRHQVTEARSIKLTGPGGAEWYLFLAPAEAGNTLMELCKRFPAAPAPTGADALKLFVSGDDSNPSGMDLPTVSPNPKEDKYGFPQPAVETKQPAESTQPEGGKPEAKPQKQVALGDFHKSLRGACTVNNTIQGITLEHFGYAEPVPGSEISQELRKRDGSIHAFYGYEVKLETQGGIRRFMYTNTRPEILAEYGAISYLVTSNHMKMALADGTFAYLVDVCEGASALRMFSSPREDESSATGQPMFDNSSEAVRWAARRAAGFGGGTVKKQIIGNGHTTVLVEVPEGNFIITDGKVEDATSEVAKAYETAEERVLITIDVGNSRSAGVTLLSGETVRVKVVPVSMHKSRKPELGQPPYPSMPPAPGISQTAPAIGSPVSPSATGTTETSVLISLDVGLPQTKEDAAALLKNAIMPTPALVLHGDADAKAGFGRKRRFLTSIADGLRFVAEHNDSDDPLVFTAIRTRVGGQDFTFHLYKLRPGIELSPALRDMWHAIVFTDSDCWYILLPSSRISPEVRKLLLESTMTR